jgi:hypothetical protein
MPLHISFVMMCALAFYFTYGSQASFKFEFELKGIESIKEFKPNLALPNPYDPTRVKG